MAEVKWKGIAAPVASALGMANRFSRYNPEEEKAVRKPDVVENEALKAIKGAWRSFECPEGSFPTHDAYEKALAAVNELDYSADDVENFSIMLAVFQNEQKFSRKAGMFLSALINNGKDSDYVVRTAHLEAPIMHIGFMNTKNVIVEGNAGDSCGLWMEGGTITVKEDAGDECGRWMQGGTITVKGDAGNWCGQDMKNGSITVEGNAGDSCGLCMQGGTITVKGNAGYGCGNCMQGGTITVEGDTDLMCGIGVKGGSITVKGNAGGNTGLMCGHGMKGGSITVKGNAGNECGWFMNGGELYVKGDIESVSHSVEGGKIFNKGKKAYPELTLMGRFMDWLKGVFKSGSDG